MSSAVVERPVVGAQEPRLSHVPAYVSSSGDDAVAVAASAGLVLDPWQEQVLRDALGERPDGRWAADRVGLIVPRQNGKGSVLEALELASLFVWGERLILHTAHEVKTAKNHYERMQRLIQGTPYLAAQVRQWRNSNEEISVELNTGAKLRFIARSTGSGRGFTADRLVLDEAMILTPESLAALMFTLTTAPNPQTWYAGSAGFETSELLAKMRQAGSRGTDPDLAYFEWSAPDDADLDDPAAWATANPALGRRVRVAGVKAEREALPEVQFARERLGIWAPTGGDSVLAVEDWDALVPQVASPELLPTLAEPAVLAVDVAPNREHASIGAASAGPDGVFVSVIENRQDAAWVVDRVAGICQSRQVSAVVVDAASPAGALVHAMRAQGVPVVEVGAREYAQACGSFYDAVQDGRLVHRGQLNLRAAVEAGRRRRLGDAWAWHRRSASTDITPLVAVTLAFSGAARELTVKKGPKRAVGRARSY